MCSLYTSKTFKGDIFVVREENGHSWESFHNSMLVCLYCQFIDMVTDSQDNKSLPLESFAIHQQ